MKKVKDYIRKNFKKSPIRDDVFYFSKDLTHLYFYAKAQKQKVICNAAKSIFFIGNKNEICIDHNEKVIFYS